MKNLKIIKKAYRINWDLISEGYLSSNPIVYAERRNEARKYLLFIVDCDEWKLLHTDEPLNYLNIPVRRSPNDDIVEFEGHEVVKNQIDEILFKRLRQKQLDDIMNDNNVTHCYISKSGSYYRPNSAGYTNHKYEAGVYPKKEAVKSARTCYELLIIPLCTSNHNQMIRDKIQELKLKLITINTECPNCKSDDMITMINDSEYCQCENCNYQWPSFYLSNWPQM